MNSRTIVDIFRRLTLVVVLSALVGSVACGEDDPDAPRGYTAHDFVVLSVEGFDLFSTGGEHPALYPERTVEAMTLSECANTCDLSTECAGFSRSKDATSSKVDRCIFKFSLPADARTSNHPDWRTYKKTEGSLGNGTGCREENSLAIDQVKATVVPPAGVQVSFRAFDCAGDPLRPLTSEDVEIINDEKSETFGSGGEGDSISDVGAPSNIALMTVLTLDMSDSIHNRDALDDVIDGANHFVDLLVKRPEPQLKHSVAIIAFGRPEKIEVIQGFTRDATQLTERLEALREEPSRGTTHLYGAYVEALNLAKSDYYDLAQDADLVKRFVVLLTDGTHEAGNEESLRQDALTLKRASEEVSIYSIGIEGNFDEARLRELASRDANYVRADDAAALESTFEDVATKVEGIARSNYVIGVCTPVALGNPSLTISVDVDGKSWTRTIDYSTEELTGALSDCDATDVAAYVPD
jgi:uncharacterized protein YegL